MRTTGLIVAALAALAACHGDPDRTCTANLAPDGVYPGYDYCSGAHYPDFTDPHTRWDGYYPEGCIGVTGEDAFACAEQTFWQAFQFAPDTRPAAFATLRAITEREEAAATLDARRLSRLNFRTAQIGVAVVAENGDTSPGAIVQRYLERAVALDPDHDVILEAWLYTVKINAAVILGQDADQYLDELWALYDRDPAAVAGTVMVLAAGMAKSSGWPDVAVDLVEHVDLAACGGFCGWAVYRAPFAIPGQYFSYAEVEARAGRRAETLRFLELTRASDRYAEWPLHDRAEAAYADVDAFMGRFAARGDDQPVTDLMVSGSTAACMVCHAARPVP